MAKKKRAKKSKRKASDAEEFVTTIPELCAAVGKSKPQFYDYKARGAPVEKVDGRYSVTAFRKWLEENTRSGGAKRVVGPDRERLLKAQADERQAKAKLAELQLEVESGSYMHMDEVKDRDVARITVVKRELLAIPKRVATEISGLAPKEVEVVLLRRMRELLNRFANM